MEQQVSWHCGSVGTFPKLMKLYFSVESVDVVFQGGTGNSRICCGSYFIINDKTYTSMCYISALGYQSCSV